MRLLIPACLIISMMGSCKLMKKEDVNSKPTETSMTPEFKAIPWSRTTVIYEVNVRQYTPEGTINAFAKHLPRLKKLGVETLWFMPLTPISQKNKKGTLGSYYACSDYTSVAEESGTVEDFKQLVSVAHKMGFKVIIDWVANHTGWDHKWTLQHPDYYLKDSSTNDFQVASGMDDIIELDYSNKEMRKAMTDAMRFWISECDVDGFRCDLAFWVELDFWKEARKELDSLKPLFWLGEYDELDKPEFGEVFDASYTWTWMHKTKAFYSESHPLDTLLATLKRYDDLGDSTMRCWFTTNHDENSWNGTEYEKYGDMAKALAVFSATWNGIPLIYSGQEIANRKRLEFFEKDPINWNKEDLETELFYEKLFRLKRSSAALKGGDPTVTTFRLKQSAPQQVLAFLRGSNESKVLVLLNFSPSDVNLDITDERIKGIYKNVFTEEARDFGTGKKITLPAWGYQVFEK